MPAGINPRPSGLAHRILGRTGVDIPVLLLVRAVRPSARKTPSPSTMNASMRESLTSIRDPAAAEWQRPGVPGGSTQGTPARSIRGNEMLRAGRRAGSRAAETEPCRLAIDRADLVYVQSLGDDRMAPEEIFASDGVCQALDKARPTA